MSRVRSRAATALAALVAMVAAPVTVVVLTATPAGAIDVTTEAQYLDAFDDPGDVEINLLNDITFTCPNSATRIQPTTTITVHGNGHTIHGCATDPDNHDVSGNAVFDSLTLEGSQTVLDVVGNSSLTDVTVSTSFSFNARGLLLQGEDVRLTGTHVGPITAAGGTAVGAFLIASDIRVEGSTVGPITTPDGTAIGLEVIGSTATVTDTVVSDVAGVEPQAAVTYEAIAETTSLVRSTVANGGLVLLIAANGEIVNSTISDNAAGVLFAIDQASVVYSDIVRNGAFPVESSLELPALDVPGGAPAAYQEAQQRVTAVLAEVGAQQVPAQLFVAEGDVGLFGSVVALPLDGAVNCDVDDVASVTSHGYNFSDDATCGFTSSTDRQDAGDPLLGPLGDNGGPTPTLLPLTGSPLINAIPLADCQADGAAGITTDQRGLPRPAESGCEIGSVEIQPPPIVLEPTFTG